MFDDLDTELIPVLTPPGDAWMLARDEPIIGEPPAPAAAARLLPSGDAYTLGVTSEDRALLVPDAGQRRDLWTPRVWPGALLVAGKVVGTWCRRAERTVTIQAWQRLSRSGREAVPRGGRIVAAVRHCWADRRLHELTTRRQRSLIGINARPPQPS